jgi:tetratricopeptide (TPR) repeat protein
MRLRVVVHAGELLQDPHGHTGASFNYAARLLDAQAGREILKAVGDTNLVLVVSEQVYQSVVSHHYPGIDHRAYQPIWVQHKETRTRAWVHLPDQPTQPDLAELARAPATPDELRAMRAGPLALAAFLHEQAARPLIGRKQERARLAGYAASIPAGLAGPLLIEGAVGMGKTRLLAALWQLAEQAGVRTVAVACPEPKVRVGLAPWRALLAMLWPEVLADPAQDVASSAGDLLVTLFGDDQADAGPSQLGDARHGAELVASVTEIIERAAAARPLLLVFEDAQHLDDRSLALLRATSARLAGKPVGFVAAIRHTDLDPNGSVERWRGELDAAGRSVLEVGPLGRDDIRAWLSRIRKVKATEAVMQRAWERSGGNPLALGYVPLGPQDGGWDDETPTATVPEVRHALQSALKRRSDACREWLGAVAVVAVEQRFDPVLVARMAQLPQHRADQCHDEARAAAIVTGRSTGRLAHEMWRDIILADLSTPRVRDLHARAFHALRGQAEQADDASAEMALQLARHALQGRPHVQAADVAAAALAAARAAGRRFDYKLAIELCSRGLEVASEPQQRVALLIEHGDAWFGTGDLDKADQAYARAGELAARYNEGYWQATAALRSAYAWWVPFRGMPVVQQRLEVALEALQPTAGDLYAQLQAQLAKILPPEGPELQRRTDLAHAALRGLHRNRINEPLAVSVILDGSRFALYETEPPANLLPLSQRLTELTVRADVERFQGDAHIALIVDLVRLGRMSEARRALEELRVHAARTRRPLSTYHQTMADTMFALWDGRFDAAERQVAAMFGELGDDSQPLPLGVAATIQQTVTAQLGWLLRERGQADQLMQQEGIVQGIISQTGQSPVWLAALAVLCAETGDDQRAVDIVTTIAVNSSAFEAFPPHGWAVPSLCLVVEVSDIVAAIGGPAAKRLATGDMVPRARALLEPHRNELALGGFPAVLIGPVTRSLGLAALGCGDHDAAIDLFKDAAKRAPDSKPVQARLHLDTARALLARGHHGERSEAMDRLKQAVRTAEELGMSRLASHSRAVLTAV